jgi:hypothetical protein
LAPKKRASQLFWTLFLKPKHLQCGKKIREKKVIFFSEKSSALDRTINPPYALRHSFFFKRVTEHAVKTLVFFAQLAYAATARFF